MHKLSKGVGLLLLLTGFMSCRGDQVTTADTLCACLHQELSLVRRSKHHVRRRVTYTEKAAQLRQADKIRDKSGGDAQTECSICLENFVMQEQLRRVGCGHLFHPRCIQEWFATGDTRCPMCRFDPVMKRWPG